MAKEGVPPGVSRGRGCEREQLDMWSKTLGDFADGKISKGGNGSGRVGRGADAKRMGATKLGE